MVTIDSMMTLSGEYEVEVTEDKTICSTDTNGTSITFTTRKKLRSVQKNEYHANNMTETEITKKDTIAKIQTITTTAPQRANHSKMFTIILFGVSMAVGVVWVMKKDKGKRNE